MNKGLTPSPFNEKKSKKYKLRPALASYQHSFVCQPYTLLAEDEKKNFPEWVGVVGLAWNKANSALLELELGLSLAKKWYTNHEMHFV